MQGSASMICQSGARRTGPDRKGLRHRKMVWNAQRHSFELVGFLYLKLTHIAAMSCPEALRSESELLMII